MPLILASGSPRRAELLASACFEFIVRPADVDETRRPEESPAEYALRVARAKAARITREATESGAVILSADTVVVAEGRIMGKPANALDAEVMLKTISGRVHDVLTAVVVQTRRRQLANVETTRVRLVPLTAEEIAWYIATGEPDGKAGAYAIQGAAARFVDWIEGSWSNVVGLPLATVYRMLRDIGAEV
jgi:septum formation protein